MPTPETLDKLYPKLAENNRCFLCMRKPVEMHHIIHRTHKLLRWDVKNLIPLCRECHQTLHDKGDGLDFWRLYLPETRLNYLAGLKKQNFKQYLLEHNLTADDFYKLKEKDIKRNLK